MNGKIYIGKSKSSPDRSRTYLGSGILLAAAIRKYGRNVFEKTIIEDDIDDIETLNRREIFFIQQYNSTDRSVGYNITMGGEGGDTLTQNPQRQKIVENMTADKNSFFGRHHTDATRNKLRQNMLGRTVSDSVKQKISNGLKVAFRDGRRRVNVTDKMRQAASKRFSDRNPSRSLAHRIMMSRFMRETNPERKTWILENLSGDRHEVSGLKNACRLLGLSYGTMRKWIGRNEFNKAGWKIYERNN